MLQRLGRVAREVRSAARLTQSDIAEAAGVSHAVISNLERGVRYPRALDQVVETYERLCGLGRDELWKRAVGR